MRTVLLLDLLQPLRRASPGMRSLVEGAIEAAPADQTMCLLVDDTGAVLQWRPMHCGCCAGLYLDTVAPVDVLVLSPDRHFQADVRARLIERNTLH